MSASSSTFANTASCLTSPACKRKKQAVSQSEVQEEDQTHAWFKGLLLWLGAFIWNLKAN